MNRTPRQNFFARQNRENTLAAIDRRQATIRERREAVQSIQTNTPSPVADDRVRRIASRCNANILRAMLGDDEMKRLGLM